MSTKQRTIKDFVCYEDQTNPIEFMAMVERYNKRYKEENVPLRIEASESAKMYGEENRRLLFSRV